MSKQNQVVAIAGLETIYDGKHQHFRHSETFLNNILTYREDHPQDKVTILDARDYKEMVCPLREIFNDLVRVGEIDLLIYSGHSGLNKLFVFFRYPEGKPDRFRFITKDNLDFWKAVRFAEGAQIKLMGCQTLGQNGMRKDECIGQWISDATGVPVWGFASRSAQKKIGNKFYMRAATQYELVNPRPT